MLLALAGHASAFTPPSRRHLPHAEHSTHSNVSTAALP